MFNRIYSFTLFFLMAIFLVSCNNSNSNNNVNTKSSAHSLHTPTPKPTIKPTSSPKPSPSPSPTSSPKPSPSPSPVPSPSPSSIPSPNPTPTSVSCVEPILTNGVEWLTTWAPYNCTTSPWNMLVSSNPTYASYSATVIASEFANGNPNPVREQEAGAYDYGHPTYYAASTDPLVTINCTLYCNVSSTNGYPAQINIPAIALPARGGDAHMSVVEPNGNEIDFWGTTAPTSNLTNGSTITALAAGNCGSFTIGTGFFTTGPGATAGGACLAAGMLRANELLSGHINHTLFLVLQCAVGNVYPAYSGAATGQCAGGLGAPLGGRLWYDVPDATTNANTSLKPWEKAILNAFHDYGAYLMDASGGSSISGIELLAESGEAYYVYGQPDPFAALSSQGWTAITGISGAYGPRWVGASPWNPSGVNFAAHMHWLAPCSAQGTC